MQGVSNDEETWDDVRDLVEPVTRPRIRELVVAPWLERERALDDGNADYRRIVDGNHRFREFQLSEGDSAGFIEEDGGEGDDIAAAALGRVPSWLNADADAAEPPSNDDASQRFLSFLLRDRPQTLVVWISQHLFLACDGPGSPLKYEPYMPSWTQRAEAFYAYASKINGGQHRLCLGVVGDEGRRRQAFASLWLPVLAALLARSSTVSMISCDLNINRHVRFLEAIVSPTPPPGGRDLTFLYGRDAFIRRDEFTEDAARVVAYRAHPDTRIEINLANWGRQGASTLAGAVRNNRWTKRLKLSGAIKLEMTELVARALRVTRSVEELEVVLPGSTPETRRCTAALLDAIADNVGLRTLKASHVCDDDIGGCVKAFWTSVLRSRSLRTVHAQPRIRAIEPPNAAVRREVALHVVELLKSNRVLTDLQYDLRVHDAAIMEAQAVPILQLNRLRAAPVDATRCWLSVLGSEPVRRHPMLRYHLLRGNIDKLVRHLPKSLPSPPSPRGSEEDSDRPHKRARNDDPHSS